MKRLRSRTLLKQFEVQAATAEQIEHARLFTKRLWDLARSHADEGHGYKIGLPVDIKSIVPLVDCSWSPGAVHCEVTYRQKKSDGVRKFAVILSAADQRLLVSFFDDESKVQKAFFQALATLPGADRETQFLAQVHKTPSGSSKEDKFMARCLTGFLLET